MNDTFIMKHVLMQDSVINSSSYDFNNTSNNNNSNNNNNNIVLNDVVFVNPASSSSINLSDTKVQDSIVKESKKHRDYDRKLWNPIEDEALQRFVDKIGTQSWTNIAELLNNQFQLAKPRSAKQCRERFHGHLDPTKFINKSAFTPEEEQKLLELQRELGSKWAEIARRLPGRTDNNCKNHWYSFMRKQNRSKGGELSIDVAPIQSQTVQQSAHQPNVQNATQVSQVKKTLPQDKKHKIPVDSDSEDEDLHNDASLKKKQKL